MTKVFISHSHKNKKLARKVYQYLESNSTEAWLDENEIFVGDSIPEKIETGITSSDFILVLLSKDSVNSGWVKREIESKLVNEITTGEISILPILCESLDGSWAIPPLLSNKMYADITFDFEKGMSEVLKALRGRKEPLPPPKSANIYLGYILGFTMAKIAWHYGQKMEKMGLTIQFKEFSLKLSLEENIIEEILNSFNDASGIDEVLKNAHKGLTIKETLSNILNAKNGDTVAAAFRFGFNLIYIMPQLEFLEVARESKSEKTPVEELLGPMKNQFDNLITDGEMINLKTEQLEELKKVYGKIFSEGAAKVRKLLIDTGATIEKEFKV